MHFEFYVLNWDINHKKAEMFNVFQNIKVQEAAEKAIKKYLRSPKKYKYTHWGIGEEKPRYVYGFDGLCEEIRTIIMWKEWSRCEYEILVGSTFSDKLEKWDCYKQAEPNVPMIVRECIYQYKKQLKEEKSNE